MRRTRNPVHGFSRDEGSNPSLSANAHEPLTEGLLFCRAPMIPAALAPYPSFLRFWSSRVASTMAQQMMMVALGWHMYDLTGSALDLGYVGLAQMLVALALLAGTHGGWIGRDWILGLSLVLGAVRAFQMPAQQALAPQLVPNHVLPRALAFSSAGMQGAIIVGPALGGLIYAWGASTVYAVSAALSLLGSALLLRLQVPPLPAHREPTSLASLFAGFRFIWQRKTVLGAVSLDLFAVLLGGATALLPIFARDILHTGPFGVGLLRSAPAVGALAMSIALSRWPIARRAGPTMFGAVAVFGLSMVVFGLSTAFWLSFAALLVSGAADMVSVVIRQSLVQLDTPDAMRGRVSAVNSIFIGASNQLGEFESGVTAAWFGAVGSVLLGGLGTLAIVGLWIKLFPGLARRERLAESGP
jgi:MFS family permease